MEQLLRWQSIQGDIIGGGGKLVQVTTPHIDFLPTDLPHALLTSKKAPMTFRQWRRQERRSELLVGAWNRPLLAGGWNESSSIDTRAFNLQTPSMFIDMRLPTLRDSILLSVVNSMNEIERIITNIDNDEISIEKKWILIRLLSRQHCFGGYSLLEDMLPGVVPHSGNFPTPLQPSNENEEKIIRTYVTHGPLFTRHHVIDWNFLESKPRPRPNRWWVEVQGVTDLGDNANEFPASAVDFHVHQNDNKNNDTTMIIEQKTSWHSQSSKKSIVKKSLPSSFKEHSFARDQWFLPVYMERWQRIAPFTHQGDKYFAMWKPAPLETTGVYSQIEGRRRGAILIMVGDHFLYCLDRDYRTPNGTNVSLYQFFNHCQTQTCTECGTSLHNECSGGGGSFVDYLWNRSKSSKCACFSPSDYLNLAKQYVDLEGSYGKIEVLPDGTVQWRIIHSTLPWQEGSSLFSKYCDNFAIVAGGKPETWRIQWNVNSASPDVSASQLRRSVLSSGEWEVMECSFSVRELNALLPNSQLRFSQSRL